MITDISQLDPNGTYTYADYLKWQFEEWIELLSGQYRVFNTPGKSPLHQRIKQAIGLQVCEKLISLDYEISFAPLPLILDTSLANKAFDLVIPNLYIINKKTNWVDETGWHGIPDLIIEITDSQTSRLDKTTKLRMYEYYGVGEYWIVQPNKKAVNVYVLEDGQYGLVDVYESGEIPSRLFPHLLIYHDRIFR